MAIARQISDFLAKPAMVGASVVVLLVAGCGKNDGDGPPRQVIGHLGPDDVTVQELENEFRLANIPADKRSDAVTKGLLLEIITRKAVARQAVTAKLDREPTMQLDLLREKEQMLASTFQQRKLSGQIAGIVQSDVDQFIAAHPSQFAKRVIFITDQIEIPAQMVTPELGAATKDAKTLAEIERRLAEKKIPMKRSSGRLDSATLPAQLAQQLQSQQAGDIFFARIGGGVFFRIVDTQSKPLSGADANNLARQLMARERMEQINRQGTADAQKAATFEGDYAKIMAEAPAAPPAPK
jgi:EpsD family peptidyl-prolyl cis-trans isomerase